MVLIGNRYRITEPLPIAETNDSILFLAEQTDLNRRVVLKRKKTDNWRLEATRTSKINHPNIVNIIEVLPKEKTIVLECINGVPLSLLDYDEDFENREERLECAIGIAHGLQAIHRTGEVHKDFSWTNIIYDMENRCPKIIDFGVNDPDWCSPSTKAPEHDPDSPVAVGPYTDVYDFGLILKDLIPHHKNIVRACLRENHLERDTVDQICARLIKARARRSRFKMTLAAILAMTVLAFTLIYRLPFGGEAIPLDTPVIASHDPFGGSVGNKTSDEAGSARFSYGYQGLTRFIDGNGDFGEETGTEAFNILTDMP